MTEVTTRTHRTLKAWRRSRRLSQRDAADLLGLSQSYYSKVERRANALPGKRAEAITKKTGVPLEMLVIAAA